MGEKSNNIQLPRTIKGMDNQVLNRMRLFCIIQQILAEITVENEPNGMDQHSFCFIFDSLSVTHSLTQQSPFIWNLPFI